MRTEKDTATATAAANDTAVAGNDTATADTAAIDAITDNDPGRWRALRASIAARPTLNITYRIAVGVLGLVVLTLGILAIPYPGPGWLIVFAGLGILATEFAWAHRTLHWTRGKYRVAMDWLARQGIAVRGLAALGTVAIVVATLWLLGTFAVLAGLIGVEWEPLSSPLFR